MRMRSLLFMAVFFLYSCSSSREEAKANMMSLVPLNEAVPVTEQWLRDYEHSLKGKLPDDYVSFIKRTNGARIPIGWESKSVEAPSIQYFFPIHTGRVGHDGLSDALAIYQMLVGDGRLPPWMAPVARNGIGGIYCISIREGFLGKVYVVYLDDDQDDVPYEKREYALIASSFTDFYQQVIGNYVQ